MNASLYPQTKQEAIQWFKDDEYAHNVLVQMRWPDGKIVCPHCASENVGKLVVSTREVLGRTLKSGKVVAPYTLTRRVWNCKGCKKQFTAKVGTLFEDSPLGLDKWLSALWLIVNAKNGISSHEVHRDLGVTQKSAWFMLHRLRLALHEGQIEKMSGRVEADETWIGGSARNMHKAAKKRRLFGKWNTAQSAVQGLLQRDVRKNHSRVKCHVVPNTRKDSIQGPVREYVLKGSEVLTDALSSYTGLRDEYDHKVVDHSIQYVRGHVHTNGLENFWCLLKRTIKGTYVCPAPFHLFRYLDEQAFRFNERRGDDQGRFLSALRGIAGKRLPYAALTAAGQSLP